MNDPAVKALADVFQSTLSPERDVIKHAEAQLKEISQQPGYAINVLKIVSLPEVDASVRQAAAVNFKNLIKFRWAPSAKGLYAGHQPIPEPEKVQIKALITGLMLSTPPLVRAQLSEALAIISKHDFPKQWPSLLPELVEKLNTNDLQVINGVFETANSIFKRYRDQQGNNAMINEMGHTQSLFAAPALQMLQKLTAQLPQVAANVAQLKLLMSSVRLICRIFFSLTQVGLTELMEQQLDTWMDQFHTYLTYVNPALDESDEEKESVLDGVKTAICLNINLFMEANEEEFAKFLTTFATDVWGLLVTVSGRPGQDNLAMAAIRFLTTVSKGVSYQLFQEASVMQQICESIVIPNCRVRPEDEELFELNPIEYIRRDSEGSDSDTRRRAAADLVKSLTLRFPNEVTALFTGYVGAMLKEYAAAPEAAWKAKDCAIFLVIALTVRGRTEAQGATTTNNLVQIGDFFSLQVLPELQHPNVNHLPFLKADAIKFITTFRSKLSKEETVSLMGPLTQLLTSTYTVVHSYAATAIERMLALRDPAAPSQTRLQPSDISAQLPALLEKLFAVFKIPDSGENEYAMKAVMRIITFLGRDIAPLAPACLSLIAQLLLEVCQNPRNPGFNHYLFESVAALIKHGAAADPANIKGFEERLFPAFEHVLKMDVQEFHPYVFQIFAQLIELRSGPLPEMYIAIFPGLLSPIFWERSSNVPALVRLLQAYLTKASDVVVSGGHLGGVLGVFQKLISFRAHEQEGFFVLNSIVECLPPAAYAAHLPTIFSLLFHRLQNSSTPGFVQGFMVFLALLICKQGAPAAAESVDKVQPGIFMMLLQQVWLPNLQNIDGTDETKLVSVATSKCLTDCPAVFQNKALWDQLKGSLEAQLTGKSQPGMSPFGDGDGEEEMTGYAAGYASLANAARPERPVLAGITDPAQYVDAALQRFYTQHPQARS